MAKIDYEVEIEDDIYNRMIEVANERNMSVDELFEEYVTIGLRKMKQC